MKIFDRRSKKASLEISIGAIVIIVLALTLLGLGLTFIRGLMSKISETSFTIQDQIKQQILDDLRTGNKKLSFPGQEITLESKGTKVIAIGVKNILDKTLNFEINVYKREMVPPTAGSPPGTASTSTFTLMTPGTSTGQFYWDDSLQVLSIGDSKVIGLKYFGEQTKGTYMYKIEIVSTSTAGTPPAPTFENYADTTFFVNIV